jgi:Sec23/Sec24 trunk domain
VEYVAPTSYQTRTPMEPWHVFLIDASANALASGATACACAAAKAATDALAEQAGTRVAVVAFDTRVVFFSFRGAQAAMVVMSDVEVRCLECVLALLQIHVATCVVSYLLVICACQVSATQAGPTGAVCAGTGRVPCVAR